MGQMASRGMHMQVRGGRSWPRRLLIGADIFLVTLLVVAGLGYGYVRYRLGSIKTGSSLGLSASDGGSRNRSGGLSPENILLIGNETRAGQTMVSFGNPAILSGSLSDIIMILHLNPMTDSASIISIPRDVFAPMPAGSQVGPYEKIDAALNDGANGPNNLIAAITQDFGIPINHYVEVNFDGFLQTVNALGGIKLNFPELLYDRYSGLNITHTGCQLLSGTQALAIVRSRHLQYDPPGVSPSDKSAWPYDPESDLARIVRDHTFVRALAATAKSDGLTDPLKANAFLGAVLKQLIIDPGLKNQLVKLVAHYRSVNPGSIKTTTIPVTQVLGSSGNGYIYKGIDMGDVEFPQQPADTGTIQRWDPGALPTPVMPAAVQVYNIAGTNQLAAQVGTALHADGFNVTLETNGTVPGYQSETLVRYHPGQLAQGISVFEHLSGAVILQSLASVPSGTVEVEAGSVLAVTGLPGSNTSTTAPSTTTSSSGAAPASSGAAPASSGAAPASTTVTAPTPGGQAPSPSADQLTPYDPRVC